ncbi:hypothetical protein TSMEX_005517, partial [Taenia solium]
FATRNAYKTTTDYFEILSKNRQLKVVRLEGGFEGGDLEGYSELLLAEKRSDTVNSLKDVDVKGELFMKQPRQLSPRNHLREYLRSFLQVTFIDACF